MATEITIKCVEGNPLAINVVMTAIEHSMINGEMVTETVDFYPDTTKPVRAVLDCTTARRQYCPQTSVTDNVVYVSDNGSISAGVYTLTITCTDTQGKKRRYKSDPCIEVYDATSAAEIAATFDSQTYELNGVFYTFAGGGGTLQADWDETDPSAPSYIQNKPDLSEYATDEELQAVEESIPDVPAWALQPQKPAYTAGEVGAVPTTRTVNGKALSRDITLDAEDVGAYQKPSTGIPKTDLASGVQTSLGKADTALQQSDLTPIETALDAKQSAISTVNVTVDNNTGTPSGSASVSGSTLSLSFQNLKGDTGATGATGPQGPQGPQGERGLPGESGVTGDVSGFTVIQTIDPSATYGATEIAGAATVQATNAELTELAGEVGMIETVEDGFYVVDEQLNIGFAIDSNGAHAINLMEYEIVNI